MRVIKTGILAVVLAVGVSGRAAAQGIPWEDAFFVNVNFGGQTGGAQTIGQTQTFSIYGEQATINTSREVKGGPIFDVVGGVPVYGKLGAALSLTFRNHESDGTVTGSIPDPIGFDPRQVSTTVAGMKHGEAWLGFLAVGVIPAAEKVDVFVMGGPAVVWVEHDVMGTVTVTEPGPTLNVPTSTVKKTVAGFIIGADVRYMLSQYVGVGGFMRFTTASADIDDATKLDLGGFQIGAGVRFRY